MFDNATPYEIVRLCVGLVAFVYTLINVVRSAVTRTLVKRANKSVKYMLVADEGQQIALLIFGLQAAFLLIEYGNLITPSVGTDETVPQVILARTLYLIIQVAMMVGAMFDKRYRDRLTAILESEDEKKVEVGNGASA